jgi:hypothetical protein
MVKIIYNNQGFSGAKVEIIEDYNWVVKKTGDISRNATQLSLLRDTPVPVPAIIYYDEVDTLVMQYIQGMPIDDFVHYYGIEPVYRDIKKYIAFFQVGNIDFDYTEVYNRFLEEIDFTHLPFTSAELVDKLPKILPKSPYYHGDFTLGNMIHHSYTWQTYLIDPVSTVFDSWVFDIAKLRQDLEGLWFIREDGIEWREHMGKILSELSDSLRFVYPLAYDDNLYILMLLRVYRHCKVDTLEYNLIRNEILRLWK